MTCADSGLQVRAYGAGAKGMHLFFNDPRVAYVTRHRRIVRHPLVALGAGGVGVAALGVAIGSAGWEPPRHDGPGPQREARQQEQQGMVMPDPVHEINLYDVPAAPQPVLGPTSVPPRVLAGPQAPKQARARPIEKATTARASQPAKARPGTAQPTTQPSAEPTAGPATTTGPGPTTEPTVQPTTQPTTSPATSVEPTSWRPGWHHHDGRGHWPWERRAGAVGQEPGPAGMAQNGQHAGDHDRAAGWS